MLEISDKSENSPFLKVTQHAFIISDSVALEVYSNPNPQNMKIANLQKGLVLLCDGTQVIGEGTGFGVPIAKYSDETVFSGSSSLYVRRLGDIVEIRKEFLMDLVAGDRLRKFKLKIQQFERYLTFFVCSIRHISDLFDPF